jgi:hypothetical protein
LEHFPQVIAQARAVPFDQGGKRGLVSGLAAEDQQAFVKLIRRVAHYELGSSTVKITLKERVRARGEKFNGAEKMFT